MEFRFNLNEIFQEPIVEVGNSLIPPGFSGDKRALWDTQSKITQIVNAMGEASAAAQGLTKPITTADRLRNSEHKLYLLIDQSANNGKGAVTGMLKTGEKGLYVFDREGQHYQVSPPCVLDFYVHESRQRSGYGKALFEHMLKKQQVEPVKMAVDRPSDKLLGFLNKHYGLQSPVKQMNNYVVYDGFFPKSAETSRTIEAERSFTPGKKQSANGLQQGTPSSPYGRYGAPRPPCSMGQIIHNDSAVIKRNQEPTGVRSEPVTNVQGPQNMTYSNPIPAWQNTQSLPNIPNPLDYAPNNPQYPYNPQYAQNQQFVLQNQNISYQPMQYPPSSGDYSIQPIAQRSGQEMHLNQTPQSQYHEAVNPYDQNTNYTLGQGDATNEINITQNMPRHNEAPGDHAIQHVAQNNNITQNPSQFFTYQGQIYYYDPRTNQYQVVPSQHQQGLALGESQKVSYNGMSVPVDTQKTRYTAQEGREIMPQPQKEALRPQAFDGTVRKVQQSASMPIPTRAMQEKPNIPAIVQETASAPVNYYQNQVMTTQNQQPHPVTMGQNSNSASLGQTLHQNQSSYQSTSITPSQSAKVDQYQPNSCTMYNNEMTSRNPNLLGQNDDRVDLNQPENIDNLTSTPQSVQSNINNLAEAPSVNQMAPQPIIINPNMNGQTSMPPQVSPVNQHSHSYQHQTYPEHQQRLAQQHYQNLASQQNSVPQSQNLNQHLQNQQNMNVMNQNQNANVTVQQPSAIMSGTGETNRLMSNVPVESGSVPNNDYGSNIEQASRPLRRIEEVDISKGYPPQHHDKTAQNSTPKADRPQSLNIETAVDNLDLKNNGHIDADADAHEGSLDGSHGYPDHEETDSLDGDPAALEAIEQEIERVHIAPKESTPVSKGSKSPGMDAAGIVTPGRNTPGLTDQGYFDLKFYHNKLW